MNFLAHAHLSFGNPGILVGNMISDFVKGRKQFSYSPIIQEGIKLHRAIDEFTDHHPSTLGCMKVFYPAYGRYAGAFVDVVYDHFLANDKVEFPTEDSLKEFSAGVYNVLQDHLLLLPTQFQKIFPHMVKYNWLLNYKTINGTFQSFGGLMHRAKYIYESSSANDQFLEHYSILEANYLPFFKDVKEYALQKLASLLDG